jgi:hypothetical protein
MNKYIFITTCIIFLGACASSGLRGGNPIDCKGVKQHCRFTGYYDEWYTPNGDLACNCVDL